MTSVSKNRFAELLDTDPDDVLTWCSTRSDAPKVRLDCTSSYGLGVYNGLHGEMNSFLSLLWPMCNCTPSLFDSAFRMCDETLGRLNLYDQLVGNQPRLEIWCARGFVRAIHRELENEYGNDPAMAALI